MTLEKSVSAVPRLTVVVPVYNERATIGAVLTRIASVDISKEIIVVDDGSTDGTREWLQAHAWDEGKNGPITILLQPRNCGKGAAVRRGFAAARGAIVIVQDADLELDPHEYPHLMSPIESGEADVVYGSRLREGSFAGALPHYIANVGLTFLSNRLTGLQLTDVWTGFKAFKREILETLSLREDRFGFEPEVTAKLARTGCRIREVAVAYAPRETKDGKKIKLSDGLRGIWTTVKYRWAD